MIQDNVTNTKIVNKYFSKYGTVQTFGNRHNASKFHIKEIKGRNFF